MTSEYETELASDDAEDRVWGLACALWDVIEPVCS